MRKQSKLKRLQELRRTASLEGGCFDGLGSDAVALPKSEKEVNAFIRGRTRLYITTWVLPIIDELIARETATIERRKKRVRR